MGGNNYVADGLPVAAAEQNIFEGFAAEVGTEMLGPRHFNSAVCRAEWFQVDVSGGKK
jgi:hypothetical protein